jgi:hypothetical protein
MNPTPVLTIGDPHFQPVNAEQTDILREEVCAMIANPPAEGVVAYKAVVVLGDILHRHDKIDLHSFVRATAFLAAIRDAAVAKLPSAKLVVIIGNHDIANNTTRCADAHAFTPLKNWASTIVADAPTEFTLDRKRFLAVPYFPTGSFAECTRGYDVSKYAAVFAHQEFRGCDLARGITSSRGDVYPPDGALCISGHIHNFSRPSPNVLYPGSPFEHHWVGAGSEAASTAVMTAMVDGTVRAPIFRHPISRIKRNVVVRFESPDEFLACESADAVVAAGGRDAAAAAAVRVKVACTTFREYADRVAASALAAALRHRGVTVVAVWKEAPRAAAAPRPETASAAAPFREFLAASLAGAPDAVAAFMRTALPNAVL